MGYLQMVVHRILATFAALFIAVAVAPHASAVLLTDWIEIGDPGNPEIPVEMHDETTGYGRVDYIYRMAEFEVTNDDYCEFLNAVAASDPKQLYHPSMTTPLYFGGIIRSGDSGSYTYTTKPLMGNKPVNHINFLDAARYANWHHNGQPTGPQNASTTEDGAYTFPATAIPIHPVPGDPFITRNPGARVYLPNEHEWHKAAFYEEGAVTMEGSGWWTYPSGSDDFPSSAYADEFGNVSNPGPNIVVHRMTANWGGSTIGNVTTVGSSGQVSPYGVREISGNVFEWLEADVTKPDPLGAGPYIVKGGSFQNVGHVEMNERNNGYPVEQHKHNRQGFGVGMRLAAAYSPFSADFDYDQDVDEVDLSMWNAARDTSPLGDANRDGVTDGADFLLWQSQLGSTIPPSTPLATSVPEPAACTLAVSAGLIGLSLRRRFLPYRAV